MSEVELDISSLVDAIKEKVTHVAHRHLLFGETKIYRGKSEDKKGHVLISMKVSFPGDSPMRMDVDIDVHQLATNKHYLDEMVPNIYKLFDAAVEARYECRRMGY